MGTGLRFDTIVDIFDHAVKAHSERGLFGVKKDGGWKYVTYAEWGELVARTRRGLEALGVGRGDKVAVIAGNSVEWAATAYAAYGRSAALIPAFEQQAAKEWRFILEDSGAKALFVSTAALYEKVKPVLGGIPTLEHVVLYEEGFVPAPGDRARTFASVLAAGEGRGDAFTRPSSTDIANIVYTSGTTSTPKGVLLSHGNIAANVTKIHDTFDVNKDDRSLSFLPWAHAFGQTCELHTFVAGGMSLALAESVDKIIDNMVEVEPTILCSVPRLFNKLHTAVWAQLKTKPRLVRRLVKEALHASALERRGEPVPATLRAARWAADRLVFSKIRSKFGRRFRFAISGGAAISPDILEFITSLGITIYEGYGLTETSPLVAVNTPAHTRVGSVGKLLGGVRVEIDPSRGGHDEGGRVEGEIIVHGPNVMLGYHNRPDENAAVFTPGGGFRTGDMGYVDDEGYLYITGRIKEQYKLENGKYVVPTPIEENLKLSPYILNAMVHGTGRPYNTALLVANVPAIMRWASLHGLNITSDELLEHEKVIGLLRREVDRLTLGFKAYEAIKAFALIDQDFSIQGGTLTPSLKLRRRQVLDAYRPLFEGLYPATASSSPSLPGLTATTSSAPPA
jgi:long-chain acyl-CoA synthetase